jgi:hypothetical protein
LALHCCRAKARLLPARRKSNRANKTSGGSSPSQSRGPAVEQRVVFEFSLLPVPALDCSCTEKKKSTIDQMRTGRYV